MARVSIHFGGLPWTEKSNNLYTFLTLHNINEGRQRSICDSSDATLCMPGCLVFIMQLAIIINPFHYFSPAKLIQLVEQSEHFLLSLYFYPAIYMNNGIWIDDG